MRLVLFVTLLAACGSEGGGDDGSDADADVDADCADTDLDTGSGTGTGTQTGYVCGGEPGIAGCGYALRCSFECIILDCIQDCLEEARSVEACELAVEALACMDVVRAPGAACYEYCPRDPREPPCNSCLRDECPSYAECLLDG